MPYHRKRVSHRHRLKTESHAAGIGLAAHALVVLLVFSMLLSLALGLSNIMAQGPNELLNNWEKRGEQGTPAEWKSAIQLLHVANKLNPLDPTIYFDIGRLYHWKAMQYKIWTDSFKENMSIAEGYYRKALKYRPSWGLAWAYLADALIKNQKILPSGLNALKKAIDLDPYKYWTGMLTVDLASRFWDKLDRNYQCKVVNIIAYREMYNNYTTFINRKSLRAAEKRLFSIKDQIALNVESIRHKTKLLNTLSLTEKINYVFYGDNSAHKSCVK